MDFGIVLTFIISPFFFFDLSICMKLTSTDILDTDNDSISDINTTQNSLNFPVAGTNETLFNNHTDHESDHKGHGVSVASWNYHHVKEPLLISIFLLASGLLKIGFHKIHVISSVVPESCLLIAIGVGFGAILWAFGELQAYSLDPTVFMLFLLPPIILDAAYSLVDRVFLENLIYILLFAVVGTILTFGMVGLTLWGLPMVGLNLDISLTESLLFASFIVAVDPVAVLSVFQEVGVNDTLYFLVFGESLLNDGVTVVLNTMMKAFVDQEEITGSQIGIGVASFFTISFGGLAIGLIFGTLTAIITKYTKEVRVVEPLAILCLAYLSYIVAELFHWSGFISIIGCGVLQAQYAFANVSRKSSITVIYFMKVFSSTSENLIFLFLGVEMLRDKWEWNGSFVLFSTFFCLMFRFIVTYGMCALINLTKPSKPISFEDQFVMWYGGMRGAVCFALCDLLRDDFRHKQMFITATIFIIGFTVFFQGMTIKPLVRCCKVKTKDTDEQTLLGEIDCRVVDHVMSGVEVIVQQKGNQYFRNLLLKLNDDYLSRWLQVEPVTQDQKILETYGELLLKTNEKTIKTLHHSASQYNFQQHGKGKNKTISTLGRSVSNIDVEDQIIAEDEFPDYGDDQSGINIELGDMSTNVRQRKRKMSISSQITMEDLQTLMESSIPVTNRLHQKYDSNLRYDDDWDILEIIMKKHHSRRLDSSSFLKD